MCCGARVVADGMPNGEMLPANGGGLLRDHRCLFLSGTYALRRSLLAPSWALRRAAQDRREHRPRLPRRRGADDVRNVICLRRSTVDHVEPRPPADGPARPGPARECRTHARQVRLRARGDARSRGGSRTDRCGQCSAAGLRTASTRGTQRGPCDCVRARRQAGPRPRAVSCPASTGVGAVPRLGPLVDRPANSGPASPHPRVSVLLPVFNDGERIGRAVDSILGQTFTDFELVVIDDGSTDQTDAELSARAADARLRVIRHEENVGLVASLNHGLSLCRGELIARLDADDWAFPTRLARQVAEFDARPELVLCGSPYERLDLKRPTDPNGSTAADACVVGDCDAPRQSRAPLDDDVPARCSDERRRLRPDVVSRRGLRPLAAAAADRRVPRLGNAGGRVHGQP